jgi:nucleoside-diphosphate-sugar epimerase
MKIAVTGSSGHVGNNLCRMLIEQGHEVRALVHTHTRGLEGLPLEIVRGSITSESDLANLCSGCETVFHLAAYISIHKKDPACLTINYESSMRLFRAAKAKGVRKIIHFSSIHAFRQKPLNEELNESREIEVQSDVSYDRSKALSQKFMMESSSGDLEIIVINPTAIIGPGDFSPSLTGSALIRLYRGQLPALIPGGYDWVDVRDVCKAAIKSIESGVPGECYLVGGSYQSLRTLAHEIAQLGGHKPPRLALPFWTARLGIPFLNIHSAIRKKEPLYTSVSLDTLETSHPNISHEKARLVLGHNPRPFTETLSDTIRWYKENKYL